MKTSDDRGTRRTIILVRLTGAICILLGLGDLLSKFLHWVAAGRLSIGFVLLIDVLLIVGGILLLLLQGSGIEIVLIGLRLTALLGPVAVIFALIDGLVKVAVYVAVLVCLAIAAMIFLSREKTKAILKK